MSEGRGRGSHFFVSLPLDVQVQGEPVSAESESPLGENPRNVRALIVDDNIDAAASLGLLLDLGGHTTCIVHSGPDVLRVVREFKPDVVLLDIGMPGMDGYEVARNLCISYAAVCRPGPLGEIDPHYRFSVWL